MKRKRLTIPSEIPLVFELRIYKDRQNMIRGTKRYFNKHYPNYNPDIDDAEAFVQSEEVDERIGFLAMNEEDLQSQGLNTVAHEVWHLVYFWARRLGYNLNDWDSGETCATLQGDTTEAVYDQLTEWSVL